MLGKILGTFEKLVEDFLEEIALTRNPQSFEGKLSIQKILK